MTPVILSNPSSHVSWRRSRAALALVGWLLLAACGPKRLQVLGPIDRPGPVATSLEERTRLAAPARIDFMWRLNEAGSRMSGVGVARVEPPYHARLDLFLDNGETVIAAALVDDDLRLPPGAPDDLLPPVDLMWATLGVFRPFEGTRLVAGERLEGDARRLRYRYDDGTELHYEIAGEELTALEVVAGGSTLQWVRLAPSDGTRYPESATYRNLVEYRELEITRTAVTTAESFDSSIWDPRK